VIKPVLVVASCSYCTVTRASARALEGAVYGGGGCEVDRNGVEELNVALKPWLGGCQANECILDEGGEV